MQPGSAVPAPVYVQGLRRLTYLAFSCSAEESDIL